MNNQAIPFIRYNGKFEINQEAVDFLNGMTFTHLKVSMIFPLGLSQLLESIEQERAFL
jgi:hypothetical protein